MQRHETVDAYIEAAEYWQDELVRLRKILQSTPLQETVKWGGPCYSVHEKNILALGAFKSYFGLWFFQGALLADREKVLINAQAGKTKAMRQWRFHSKREINARLIKSYIKEAIDLQNQGLEVKPDRNSPVAIPQQLRQALTKNKKVQAGFSALTKGKQRDYAEYIAAAKRDETKVKRLEKVIPMILAGQGLNDKYR